MSSNQSSTRLSAQVVWGQLLDGELVVVQHQRNGTEANVITVRAGPGLPEPLSRLEACVAARRALGTPHKVLAMDFECSTSSTSKLVRHAMRKLKIRTEAELVAFFLPGDPAGRDDGPVPTRQGLRAARMGGSAVALQYPTPSWSIPPSLTVAERLVLHDLVAGDSTADIARRRCTSTCTVAIQMASLYRKIGVGSRLDAFVALQMRAVLCAPSGPMLAENDPMPAPASFGTGTS